ncbi:permease [Geodermatophilus sabuli]|uniref:Permease n=1 Tax=Geodermatophilus sabuli TaxID=1564158 RepID=A0A285EG73_9ACTN|nr:permease [Geodermatophilus sabuli]MBB3086505.1 hypothetical protein [Geodermatophilus sabuli]SNX97843.1 hypothetical protein SAMN06893097_108208 [Geodermatophilus sabuli]
MQLTAAHWVYVAGVASLIAVMLMRKNVVVPAIIATFVTTWLFTGDFLNGLGSVFSASMVATTELLSIFLVLTVVTALLGALRAVGADRRMIAPLARLMKNGPVSYIALFVVTYLLSLVFWPTPTLALVAATLLPAAIAAGLSPLGAAMAIAIAGQGMALASDYVIGVAPSLSAGGAGVPAGEIADRALVLSLVVGGVAITMTWFMHVRRGSRSDVLPGSGTARDGGLATLTARRVSLADIPATVGAALTTKGEPLRVRSGGTATATDVVGGNGTGNGSGNGHGPVSGNGSGNGHGPAGGDGHVGNGHGPTGDSGSLATGDDGGTAAPLRTRHARLYAIAVPLAFAVLVAYLLLGKATDLVPEVEAGWGAALVGGLALLLMLGVTTSSGGNGLERAGEHFVDGLVFAFRAMGVVIPVAGFVLVGISDFAGRIMLLPEDAAAPGFLFDVISSGERFIPDNSVVVMFAMLIAGMLIGLDGSGWAGLPFTGSMADAFASSSGGDTATLAAIAQNAAGWTGGGTLIIWSSLIAVAGLTGVPVTTLARKLFIPVVTGLVLSVVVAAVIW